MSRADVEVVRGIYESFERGDVQSVLAALDADIEWIEPNGYFPGAQGIFRGRDEVQRIFALYPDYWEEFVVEPEEFLDAGDHVVMVGREYGRSRRTGRDFEGRVANVWTMRNGKAIRLRIYKDTAMIWKALGGAP